MLVWLPARSLRASSAGCSLGRRRRERRAGGSSRSTYGSSSTRWAMGSIREILRRRVLDGVLLRLIDKWLNAGVLEDGGITYPDAGSPQGGVVSPIIANIYLHEVLDVWFEREVKPRLSGRATLVRYADDAVLFFAKEQDARKVMAVLPKRFDKYGLTLHPEKTRLVDVPPPRSGGDRLVIRGHSTCSASRTSGAITLRKVGREALDRQRPLSKSARARRTWCRCHRHDDLREQQLALASRLRGHYGYFGITGNPCARSLRLRGHRSVAQVVDRRSQNAGMTWERMLRLLKRYPLPQPRIARPTIARAANP